MCLHLNPQSTAKGDKYTPVIDSSCTLNFNFKLTKRKPLLLVARHVMATACRQQFSGTDTNCLSLSSHWIIAVSCEQLVHCTSSFAQFALFNLPLGSCRFFSLSQLALRAYFPLKVALFSSPAFLLSCHN